MWLLAKDNTWSSIRRVWSLRYSFSTCDGAGEKQTCSIMVSDFLKKEACL